MRRLHGGVKLAGVRGGAAAAFYSVGARREQKKERNRSLGSLKCSCARWKGSWGSAASSPRRRRGGGREEVLGAWHGRERPARSYGAMEEALGRRVGDSATEKGGREASPRRRRRCRRWAAARTEQGVEVEEKGDFAISKNSRDYYVNQR